MPIFVLRHFCSQAFIHILELPFINVSVAISAQWQNRVEGADTVATRRRGVLANTEATRRRGVSSVAKRRRGC